MENQTKNQEQANSNSNSDSDIDIDKLLNIAQKWNKHKETVYRNIKKYQQNHKNDPHYIQYCRQKSKKHYESHKAEYHQKYVEKKNKKIEIEKEIFNLMNISIS
jgi:IS30 family transposase